MSFLKKLKEKIFGSSEKGYCSGCRRQFRMSKLSLMMGGVGGLYCPSCVRKLRDKGSIY